MALDNVIVFPPHFQNLHEFVIWWNRGDRSADRLSKRMNAHLMLLESC